MGFMSRIRANYRAPLRPYHLIALAIFPAIVLPSAGYAYFVQHLILREPEWLAISNPDLIISRWLFGTYDQNRYVVFLASLWLVGLLTGVLVAYPFVRRLLNQIRVDAAIPNGIIVLNGILDLLIALAATVATLSVLGAMAGVTEPVGIGHWGLASPALVMTTWSGYVAGATFPRVGLGVWWGNRIRTKSAQITSE